jgi:hypothetical protein
MIRQATSYVLTAVILLSQVGLPLHLHYCKGMLESVSVFFSQGCDDHHEVADLSACCKKIETTRCSGDGGDCCDDKVNIVIQDIIYPVPHFLKWACVVPVAETPLLPEPETADKISFNAVSGINTGSGPPIYILYKSLIFYA